MWPACIVCNGMLATPHRQSQRERHPSAIHDNAQGDIYILKRNNASLPVNMIMNQSLSLFLSYKERQRSLKWRGRRSIQEYKVSVLGDHQHRFLYCSACGGRILFRRANGRSKGEEEVPFSSSSSETCFEQLNVRTLNPVP